ncbi:MAG: EpsG family protein [Clostridia bacterium]|nr:EpsG family protein [Clostridia bacterium]
MVYNLALAGIFLFALAAKPFGQSKGRKLYLALCFIMLVIVSGCRFQNEFSDFQVNYNRVIQASRQTWGEALTYSTDFIHQLFRKSVAMVFKDPQWYFILSAAFMVGTHMKCFEKYADCLWLCVLLYFSEFGFFQGNNTTRQTLAVAVTILSWKYLLNKDFLKYNLTMFAAFFVHTSAIFFYPMYFLANIGLTKKNVYAYTFVGAVILAFNGPIISFFQRFLYSDYGESSYGMTSSNSLRLVLALACGVMILINMYSRKRNWYDPRLRQQIRNPQRFNNLMLNGTFLFMMCTVLSVLRILLFSRVALYFAPCAIISFDKAIKRISNKNTRMLVAAGVVAFFLVWVLYKSLTGKLIPATFTPFWLYPDRMMIY